MRLRAIVPAASLLCLIALGAAPAAAQGERAAGERASRIVSIGGAVTETLWALGLGDRVIAVDTTSTFPPDAEALPDVGYMRALSPEGVLSASPDLILAVDGAGPPEAIAVLRGAGVPFVLVPNAPSGAGAGALIRAVAEATGEAAAGEALAVRVEAETAAVAAVTGAVLAPRRAAFVLATGDGAPLVAGRGTAADAMLSLAGARNVFSDISGYKPATPEAALAAGPEVIVTMQGGGRPASEAVAADPALGATPAARDGAILSFDGTFLLGFGPRTAEAARALALALHPGLALPEPSAPPGLAGAGGG